MASYSLEEVGRLFMDNASTLNVSQAYNHVGFFRRAVDIRKNGVATMPYDFRQGQNEIATEQTIEEVDLPLMVDVFDLIPAWSSDLDMYSAAYGLFLSDELGLEGPGWVRIHPSRVTPQYDHRGMLSGWRLSAYNRSELLPVERLLYIWQPNQTSDRGPGEAIAKAALTNAGILKFSGEFQSAFFEQGALTPTILGIKGFDKLSPSIRKATRAMLRKLMGGISKAFQLHPMDGSVTVNTLQQPLKDMALKEVNDEQKEAIAATLGVPMSLMMSNAANYATATQDDFNFYDKAISPLCTSVIAKQLNRKLFNPLGYSLAYQATRLDAYQAIELQKSTTLNGMLDRNVIDIPEYRASMGLPALELADDKIIEGSDLPEIFAYHIESGVVTHNEVRERLGFKPENASGEQSAKDLQAKLSIMQAAVNAGIPPEQAAKLAGLPVMLPAPTDTGINQELKNWRNMAVKRYLEKKPEKALEFTSDVIPEALHGKIREALATVETVDSVKTVFRDARLYNA